MTDREDRSSGRRGQLVPFVAGFLIVYGLIRWVPAILAAAPELAGAYAIAAAVQAVTLTTAALLGAALVLRRARRTLDRREAVTPRRALLVGALAAALIAAFEATMDGQAIRIPAGFPIGLVVFAGWALAAVVAAIGGAVAARVVHWPWMHVVDEPPEAPSPVGPVDDVAALPAAPPDYLRDDRPVRPERADA